MSEEEASQLLENGRKSASALRTIGEVAEELELPQHVLRFWEKRFNQIKPVKRRGRRYYRPEDINLLHDIKRLLHHDGFTIKGVQKFLEQNEVSLPDGPQQDLFAGKSEKQKAESVSLSQSSGIKPSLSRSEIELLQYAITSLSNVKTKLDGLL